MSSSENIGKEDSKEFTEIGGSPVLGLTLRHVLHGHTRNINREEQQQVRKLLRAKQRRLNALEVKAAPYGLACPTEITLEMEDLWQEIEGLKSVYVQLN